MFKTKKKRKLSGAKEEFDFFIKSKSTRKSIMGLDRLVREQQGKEKTEEEKDFHSWIEEGYAEEKARVWRKIQEKEKRKEKDEKK